MECKLVKISHIEFKQSLWMGLWDILNIPFMTLYKLCFVVD
jgi:hypothetical protein